MNFYVNYNIFSGSVESYGLSYFVEIFSDPDFYTVIRNTFVFVIGVVPTSIVVSLFVAIMLNRIKVLSSFFRSIYFLPFVTRTVAVSIVWSWLFHKKYGLINYFLSFVGVDPIAWLRNPEFAYLLEEYLYYSNFFVLKELDSDERFKDQWVNVVDIKQNPGDYVLQNSFKNKSLIPLFKQGFYCHSNGEPLGDYDPAYQELEKILQDNELTFLNFNVSGHATRADLISIAKEVGATYTIPWHSLHPELLKDALEKAG